MYKSRFKIQMNLTCWEKSMKLWRRSMCKKYVQIKDVDAIHWIVPRNGYFYMRDTLRLPSRRLVWGKVCYCLSILSFLLLYIILTSESSILIMVASVPIYPPATSLVGKYINGIKFFKLQNWPFGISGGKMSNEGNLDCSLVDNNFHLQRLWCKIVLPRYCPKCPKYGI